ncbi:BTB/POZ domain-containing protein 2-like [Contarinia nasturtii]|uniref:BTB/POZ domain-containing protein 2-like n=1 Tax=Contarinia nasturtii TaxID=265458 RepID=UPI0012D3F294|nr:BTB/POZ domain-containing protein 2-like [Contarinia nasturtii]
MANILKNIGASQAVANLYLNDRLADVRFLFVVDGKSEEVPANRSVLAALSSVFDKMFYGSLKEETNVKIVDASAQAFKEFLQFFYLSEVSIGMNNIETVVRLADKYDIFEYINTCSTLLQSQLNANNLCWGYQLALSIKNQNLIEFCENEISKSPKEVFASEPFERCDSDTLENILKLNLTCNEADILNACIKWAKNACRQNDFDENQGKHLKNQLGDCFKLIRFGTMKMNEFTAFAVTHDGFFTPDEFKDIIFSKTVGGYESKIFNQNARRYKWNENKILNCYREIKSRATRNVESTEILRFVSNKLFLLGEIYSVDTFYTQHDLDLRNCDVDVCIAEFSDQSYPGKIICEGSIAKSWQSGLANDRQKAKMILPTPVLIQANCLYEIRLKLKSNKESYYKAMWTMTTTEMKSGLTIDFHQSPSVNYDTSSCGWISQLGLNII